MNSSKLKRVHWSWESLIDQVIPRMVLPIRNWKGEYGGVYLYWYSEDYDLYGLVEGPVRIVDLAKHNHFCVRERNSRRNSSDLVKNERY